MGEPEFDRQGRATIELVSDALQQYPSAFATMLNALDFALATRREVALIGDVTAAETQMFITALNGRFMPNVVVAVAQPDQNEAIQLIPLLQDRPQRDGKPTAYVCRSFVCNLPTTDIDEMIRQLEA
jgi:uncharacterized protein YyaL (SSP411 family)